MMIDRKRLTQKPEQGGIFGPPDRGYPPTGVLAIGELNARGWTYADVDLAAIADMRRDGVVSNRAHGDEQTFRHQSVTKV